MYISEAAKIYGKSENIIAFQKVFGVDKKKDWNEFFTKYRGNATCEVTIIIFKK